MMRKSIFKKLLCLLIVFTMILPAAACNGGGDTVINDGKTINVKVYKAGYGADYIYTLKEKFEALYKDEGYKINVLAPQRDIEGTRVLQDIYAGSGIDVYFTQGINLGQGLYGEYGKCVSDITESVYAKAPLRFDGTEESLTVKEKLRDGSQYDIYDTDGSIYGLPYVQGFGGLVVNKTVLDQYDLELPRTTTEFFNCYSEIMKTADSSGVFPYTFINGQVNYPAHLTNMWMAQYSGADWLDSFWSLTDSEGNNMQSDGYQMFADETIYETLSCLYETFDPLAAAYGSATQDIVTAQAQIMRGTAVFMSTGDYFFNEESLSFSSKLKDITIINIPVISSLGTKVFGAGTSYNFSTIKSEEILCDIIDLVDANETVEDIISKVGTKHSFTPDVADIERICAARGATYNRTTRMNAYISEKSEMKDIAALFLRMCASDDGANAISQKTLASNPFSSVPVHAESEYQFLRSANAVLNNRYLRFCEASVSGFREKLGLTGVFPYTGLYVHTVIFNQSVSIYNDKGQVTGSKDKYSAAARTLAESISSHASTNWDKWLSSAGL